MDEHAVASPAKLRFLIKKNVNGKHKTQSFIYLFISPTEGVTARAARIIGTSQPKIKKKFHEGLFSRREK